MGGAGFLLLSLLVTIATSMAWTEVAMAAPANSSKLIPIHRFQFPPGFYFGASSSAYQYEGAAFIDGKGPSIWDNFTHTYPQKIKDRSNGDVALDFYHRYPEDVKLLKEMGANSFRFSISWSRILPKGTLSGGVNQAGVTFYMKLIKELLANGITPFVTIFHWDVPQALHDAYGGFLSPKIVNDFADFAKVCFEEFGNDVKYWITENEPYVFILAGYTFGVNAPGRCSSWLNPTCTGGDSAIEPYIVGHNLLLSHARAVQLYKQRYQRVQRGQIGITLVSFWFVPHTQSKEDLAAVSRAYAFMYGWFLNPLVYGDYPKIMKDIVGKRLPSFTTQESRMLRGSYDFIGLNYYTSVNASDNPNPPPNQSMFTDNSVTGSDTYVYANGLRNLLIYTKKKYRNPIIYITEYGISQTKINSVSEGIKDEERIEYYNTHLHALNFAIRVGVRVKGSLAWSFMDNFEWSSGFTERFGLYFVDHTDNLKRVAKASALWFKEFLNHK